MLVLLVGSHRFSWFSVVLAGSQWFFKVLGGSQCFSVLLVGSHRFSVFSYVLSGSAVVLAGSQWIS